ncbi:unnamed protein product, partial [Closterium sp. NIES-53]
MLLTCYTDASFNSVKADGTSIGGYVCLFGGGAVSWRSKKQNEVGLSSCETEYMALHHGVKEVVWLRRLLEEIGVCQKEPTVILCDNESAVKLANNACLHVLTKHVRPKWHWVRRLLDKEVQLEIVKTHQQAAGILTNRLAENEHWKGMKLAGMSWYTRRCRGAAGGAGAGGTAGATGGAPGAGAAGGTSGAAVDAAGAGAAGGAAGATGGAAGGTGAVGGSMSSHSRSYSRPLHCLRVPLPSPPTSSLPDSPDPKSDSLRTASPTVTCFLATAVTDPLFESTAASALVAELVDFAAACRLDYATSLVAESASASVYPPSVGGECALGTHVLEDRQEEFECFAAAVPHLVSMLLAPEGDPDAPDIPTPRSYAEAIEGPYSSQWQAAMDAEMASWKSTGTYVDEVPPPGANIVSGMWIFRVKRPPGSPPVFKVRYVARGFSQRQGVDLFHTFSPTPKMTTLRVLLHVPAQRDYELHSLDLSTAFLQGSLHEEIWLRRPPGFTWSTTLGALGFAPSTADPSLFLRTDTTLPPFYVLVYVEDLVFATTESEALSHVKSELQKRHTCTDLGELTSYLGLRITQDRALRTITLTQSHMVQQVLRRFGFTYSSPQSTPLPTGHSLSAPPSDESVEPSGPYPELVGCLITSGMGLVLGGRARVVLTSHGDASWVDDLATQRSSQGYTFSLGSGSVSWRSTRSSSVLSSSCEAEIYTGAMAAQELRWLTYLLTDLGEAPRSPPVLYRRGQLCLAYEASQANTADVFTKALQPCNHQ